jgi:hypothetical protein
MGLFSRSRKKETKPTESAPAQRTGKRVSEQGTTVFAFRAYTPEAAGGALIGVNAGLSETDLGERIRREARQPKASVVVVEPSDWRAPRIASLSQTDIVAAFPDVVKNGSAALHQSFGVGPLDSSRMLASGVGAMPHPLGHVLFLFVIPGQYEWAAGNEPTT